jgi:DNA ligase (NAD+)
LNLIYEGGQLIAAVTRGDGTAGDDVTANVIASLMVPTKLFATIDMEVRGEVYMDFDTFDRLNAELTKEDKALYANPRNAAAGALRLRDPVECAKRGLKFAPHGVVCDIPQFHSSWMTWLLRAGFGRLRETAIRSIGEFDSSVSGLRDWLGVKSLGYPIDGLVFKLDSHSARQSLGSTARAPKWAVALKFTQETVSTTLKAITVQVGRSGVLCPVAELEPVWVDGSTVSRATLHNEAQVRRLGLQIGDTVEVEKMGAIIPGIKRSITADKRYADLELYASAKHPEDDEMGRAYTVRYMMEEERPLFDLLKHVGGKCPCCGSKDITKSQTNADKESAAWRCMNQHCPAQLAGRILHLCSRKCLNISGIGSEMAEALASIAYDLGCEMWAIHGVKLPSPLSMVTSLVRESEGKEKFLANVTWTTECGGRMTFGKARAARAMQAIRATKSLPLHRWLCALGIPSIGENTSKEISRLCMDTTELANQCGAGGIFDRLANGDAKSGELAAFEVSQRIGQVSAKALCEFMVGPDADIVTHDMFDWGIESDNYDPKPVNIVGSLAGKLIVVTGVLSISRSDMQSKLEAAGAKVSNSISKKTDFLVAGKDCGSKLAKAKSAAVVVLSEAQIMEMMG